MCNIVNKNGPKSQSKLLRLTLLDQEERALCSLENKDKLALVSYSFEAKKIQKEKQSKEG